MYFKSQKVSQQNSNTKNTRHRTERDESYKLKPVKGSDKTLKDLVTNHSE